MTYPALENIRRKVSYHRSKKKFKSIKIARLVFFTVNASANEMQQSKWPRLVVVLFHKFLLRMKSCELEFSFLKRMS